MERNNTTAAIIRQGAESGFLMGLIFLLMFFCWTQSSNGLLALLFMVLFIAVPVIIYRQLRHSYISATPRPPYSALWLRGIFTFIGGAIILAMGVFIFFKWIDPDFILRQLRLLIEVSEQTPEMAPVGAIATKMIDNNLVPKSMELAMSALWTTSFSGSIVSAVLAFIVTAFNRKTPNNNI